MKQSDEPENRMQMKEQQSLVATDGDVSLFPEINELIANNLQFFERLRGLNVNYAWDVRR